MVAVEEDIAPLSGLSRDELIKEFMRLDAAVKDFGSKRKEVSMALAGIAYEHKGSTNTVHLKSTDGQRISVAFGFETEYVTEDILEVSKILGRDMFDSLFKTKLEFVAKKRELQKFLNTVDSDERIETAKMLIRDATITKDKTPYVSVE